MSLPSLRPLGSQAKKVRTLATGMLVAQVGALVATPLLTRLYAPSEFGVYALVLALITVLAPIAALRFDFAIPIPEAERDAWGTVVLCFLSSTALAIALTIALGLAGQSVAAIVGIPPGRATMLLLVPIAVLLSGAMQALAAWSVRTEQAARAATGRGTQGVGAALAQIALGFNGASAFGLIVGDVVGRVAAVVAMMPAVLREQTSAASALTARELYAVAYRFRGFATVSTLAALVNALNASLPVLLVGRGLGLPAAGLLLLAQRVASLPTSLLVTAISQVFAVEFARTADADDRHALFRSTLRRYGRVAAPLFAGIALVAPLIFATLFGAAWGESGRIAAALTPFFFLQLLSGATMSAIDVLQAHRARLLRELVFLVGMAGVVWTSLQAGLGIVPVALCISAFGVVFYVFSLLWVSSRIRTSVNR